MTSSSENQRRTRQLLGMRGADTKARSLLALRVQLMKPVTWIPLMWGVLCGAASGGFTWSVGNVLLVITAMVMSGPLLAGYTQTVNDYYDREIDAINEPYRPIPSGAISLFQVKEQILLLLGLGLATAYTLDRLVGHSFPTIFVLAAGGTILAYIYSAPPLKLKQNGWLGNYALGASYIALPWWCGHALFGTLTPTIVILTLFYSFAGLGIAIVNDFKSVEGDQALGLKSLPVMFGIPKAAWICVLMIDVFQVGVLVYLIATGKFYWYGAILLALILPQMYFQKALLADPLKNDVRYQASAQPFLVLGMLVTGLALGAGV
ncbi:chlorophyll synthase ChlG [Candidatus Cyanaurora vandensis]|uniref:chlorophyll synthase ChlG n=1 Tax=Candidatus Cyanaurora vandensis TaxID=2714958 RepID=UPI00257E56E8|nr:chlorophyll synthase ChlG [Candidatus Cyanaurora vandensis]